ncbi:MAG: LysR family transcriptional regulator [Rhodospirillaceae bacterium]|nr:LysR family transcriptional regulator [Rhodospirillaceae bacterium]
MGQLEDMNTFVRIVEAGSISRAADQLGVVKSAISRRLVDLEARLNVQLLNRTTRKSSLTDAGRSYYQRAQEILADVGELNATTSNTQLVLEGDLKIAVPLSFGLSHLAPVINEFAVLHPGVVIHIDFADRQIDMVEEGFDLAVRIADLKDSTLIARKLFATRNILCASPAYLERAGTPERPSDLKSHDVLHYTNTPGASWHFTNKDGNQISVKLNIKLNANNGEYLCAAAVNGLGIAALPTFIAYKDVENGNLVRVLGDYALPSMNAYAVYPQTKHLSARVRALIEFLSETFASPPHWDQCLKGKTPPA